MVVVVMVVVAVVGRRDRREDKGRETRANIVEEKWIISLEA